MTDSKLEIIIAARDLASGVIQSVTGATRAYQRTLQETNGTASEFSGTIRDMFLAFGGFSVIQSAVSAGYKFNSTMEETKVGLASLIYSMREFTDSTGTVVTGQRAFDAALGLSVGIQNRLRIAGLETAATYEQLTKAYTQAYVPAIKAGFDEKRIVLFTTAIVQAATAMRVPLDMLGEEIRSILSGNMTPRNTMLQPLMEAAGLTNEKINQLNKTGMLYPAIMKALEGATVGAAEASKNFSVQLSNLKDAAQQALGVGLQVGFEKTKVIIKDVTDKIVTFNKETGEIKWNETLVVGLQKLDAKIFSIIDGIQKAGKAITDFTNNHPLVTDMVTNFGGLALKILAVLGAIKIVGGGVIWLVSHWAASIAFMGALVAPVIEFIGTRLVAAAAGAALGIGTMAGAIAVASIAATGLAVAFAGWQLGKQIGQMEILGLTINEAMQAGYASVAKFFAYSIYAWDMIGATAKSVWGQVKEAGTILFTEFIATIQESFPKMAQFFGLTDDYRKKADAARAAQSAIYQEFFKNQTAAQDKLKEALSFQDSIRESIFREADARKRVKDSTDSAAKSTSDLTGNTKKGAEAAMEYVLKHRDVNQVLDRMKDHLTAGAEKIKELQFEIQKLSGSKIGAKYIEADEQYEKGVAAANKNYEEMVRIERELGEKLTKAREDAAKKNKTGEKKDVRYGVDPAVLGDMKTAGDNVVAARVQMNTQIELLDKKRAATNKVTDREVLAQIAAGNEAEITQRLAVLDVLEKEGTASRENVAERIGLMEKQKGIQEDLLNSMVKANDVTAWNSQKDKIIATNKALADLYRASAMQTPFGAARLALSDLINKWTDTGQQMYDIATTTAQAMQQSFNDFFFDAFQGNLKSLGDYVNSFLTSVQRAIANALSQQTSAGITGGIRSGLGNLFSPQPTVEMPVSETMGAVGGYVGASHSGGMGNEPSFYRLVPNLNMLPRYHKGLGPGERISITTDDEMTLTPGQQRAMWTLARESSGGGGRQSSASLMPNITVNIENQTGTQMETQQKDVRFDHEQLIINVVAKKAKSDPGFRNLLASGGRG